MTQSQTVKPRGSGTSARLSHTAPMPNTARPSFPRPSIRAALGSSKPSASSNVSSALRSGSKKPPRTTPRSFLLPAASSWSNPSTRPSTIGLDIAKWVFQAHGADATGRVVFRKRLVRAKVLEFFAGQPPCLVALEACGGAHYWARELGKLGHTVRLIPPAYVKPFVKRQKND